MYMFKYVLKRLGLLLLTFAIIMLVSFILIKLIEPNTIQNPQEAAAEEAIREALGYNKPILVQFGIYLKNLITKFDLGISFKIQWSTSVNDVISGRLLPTLLLNVYSIILSVPLGIGLGIFAALKKNKWQDHVISTVVILFVSVPSYVYAFILQYFVGHKWGWFPITIASLDNAGNSWFSFAMFHSMVLPILALSFGVIAGLARFTRAELTEVLTSDFMLLARTKGLTKGQATVRHALKNSMVPIFPTILAQFIGILSGSFIIEGIFTVPGIGSLLIDSITMLDYNIFMATSMFYTVIGLVGGILVDLSYGFLDPRIRMGAR